MGTGSDLTYSYKQMNYLGIVGIPGEGQYKPGQDLALACRRALLAIHLSLEP